MGPRQHKFAWRQLQHFLERYEMADAISSYSVEHRIIDGGTEWIAIRARGAEWSWLTPAEAAELGRQWVERYGPTMAPKHMLAAE
jgi:hypothetical protein